VSREVVIPTPSLIASAVRYPGKAPRIHNAGNQAWQRDCYRHYAICGEARAAARFMGRALSRTTLRVAREGEGTAFVEDGTTHELPERPVQWQRWPGSDAGKHWHPSHYRRRCYLIGRTTRTEDEDGNIYDQGEVWEIVSVLEVKVTGTNWSIDYGDGHPVVNLSGDDIVIRIWQPNPAKRIEADSPFSLTSDPVEIEWADSPHLRSTVSRLAGAGILSSRRVATFPHPEVNGKPQVTANEADAFMLTLGDAMMTPLGPSSPSSLIPIIVTAPTDAIDKARLMTFWTELDAQSKDMRAEAITRFAVGMDLPAEQILGMSANSGTGGGRSNGVSLDGRSRSRRSKCSSSRWPRWLSTPFRCRISAPWHLTRRT